MVFRLFILLTLFVPVLTWAENQLISPYIHKYEANYIYEGNTENKFKDDFIAVLDDGSHWRIHSKDCEQFSKWNFGDLIHVQLQCQTEWCLFKKYHLLLFNHECDESVEVSLLQTPLTVSLSTNPQPTSSTVNGSATTYRNYRQNITTSDGQKWEIIDPKLKNSFPKDTPVYIGYNVYNSPPSPGVSYYLKDEKKHVSFFIINGAEQNLDWRWTHKGNYKYYWLSGR